MKPTFRYLGLLACLVPFVAGAQSGKLDIIEMSPVEAPEEVIAAPQPISPTEEEVVATAPAEIPVPPSPGKLEALDFVVPAPASVPPAAVPGPEASPEPLAAVVAPAEEAPARAAEPVGDVPPGGDLQEKFRYINDNLGERLIVTFERREDEDARNSLELRLFDDTYYSHETHQFETREVFVVTGKGLTTGGVRFVVDNIDLREQFISFLRRFSRDAGVFSGRMESIVNRGEDWMGEGINALDGALAYGSVEADFFPRPMDATFQWNLRSGRIWTSLGGLVNIDSEVVDPLIHLISNIEGYRARREEYRSAVEATTDEIASLITLPGGP